MAPEVLIDNTLSNHFTVLQASRLDQPGLLHELTDTLSNLNLASAHIAAIGEKAVDVFYVTDLTNKKIESNWRRKAVEERLLAVLAGAGNGNGSGKLPGSGSAQQVDPS